jgi:hypothetical protein
METYHYPTAKEIAAAEAAARAAKSRAAIQRNTIAEFAPGSPNHPLAARGYVVTVLAPSTCGRNARGTAGAKRGWGGAQPKGAKHAKRQNVGGHVPALAATRWNYV